MNSDIPITGDWNGDGKTDVGVFRPSTRQFIFNTSPVTRTEFGLKSDIPITGDWNGDGKMDVGVFRPSAREFIFNTSPVTRTAFGLGSDIPITGKWVIFFVIIRAGKRRFTQSSEWDKKVLLISIHGINNGNGDDMLE